MPAPSLPGVASISLKQYLEEPWSAGPPVSAPGHGVIGPSVPLTGEFPNKPAATMASARKPPFPAR